MRIATLCLLILGAACLPGCIVQDIHDQIGQVFGDRLFNTVITKSIRLEESPAYKESIFTFAPRSSGAMEYYSLSEEILSRV